MKTLYRIICSLLIFSAATLNAQEVKKAEELVWHTDMVKAAEISRQSNKPIFAFFTGSDWCGWCKKLQRDVFAKPDFVQWASKNVTLVELDFPRGKALSPELQQQNASLQQTFQVAGYPTIWIFYMTKNAEGTGFNIESFGSLGYPPNAQPGKEELKFLYDANAILAKAKGK